MARPTWAEVDLTAIAHNARQLKQFVGPRVKLMAVVKANAYGHGAVEVSRAALSAGAEMLAVASVEEAAELRQASIAAPILVLSALLPDDIDEALRLDLRLMLCELSFAKELAQRASRLGKRALVHLKVDVGMGRLGVPAVEALPFAREIADLASLEIEGCYAHLPCADTDQALSRQQIHEFARVTSEIEAAGIPLPIKHLSNSAAFLDLPEARFDLVRAGLILYGLYPQGGPRTIDARPALSLHTHLILLRPAPEPMSVSYGGTYRTSRPTVVGVVPLGYADGYNRLLSNRGQMLVRGQRVPVVGRVCMDLTLIDLEAITEPRVGEEVVAYGSQGDDRIAVEEVASLLGTIPYEVTCAIGRRVPRVYVDREQMEPPQTHS